MEIQFTKMHGLGNDFVIIDCINQSLNITPDVIKKLADRRFGIGCDQVLLVYPSNSKDALFSYRIFNQDGGEVSQCGNGARCFARFVADKELTDQIEIPVETNSGLLLLTLQEDNKVEVNMGVPDFHPADIPLRIDEQKSQYTIITTDSAYEVFALALGNPHAILIVDDVSTIDVAQIGRQIQHSGYFPEGVNVGFMQVIGRSLIKLRVFERGVGETLACGSGACAAVAAGIKADILDPQVRTQLTGGQLEVEWKGDGQPIIMTGPTANVFEGRIEV